MFDFVNYTYSGVLAILSTLFGLSYALILSCIEKIDTKYHSTKLSARFLEEKAFKSFRFLLILNLVFAVLFPFLMDGCCHSRYLIALQCIAAVVMIYCAFKLFNRVMDYYDAGKLQDLILTDYHEAVKIENRNLETKYFIQWSDLTAVLLASADEELVQSVYNEWDSYVERKKNQCKGKPLIMDDYFYEAVTRINENLCKGERKPISVNNGNSLLTSLIVQDSIVTDETYSYLWKNLRLQLFYNRDEWIMAYWKTASHKYHYFMPDITTFETDNITGEYYTDKQVEERIRQRNRFAEFHIMLCAMLLQQRKYNLLGQILFYTFSQPPIYPLVPSSLSTILKMFVSLNEGRKELSFYYEEHYPMPNMHGITAGKILGAANCFMALLVYRLYVLIYPYGRDSVFRPLSLPDNQAQLTKFRRDLDTLKYWFEKIKGNMDAMESIHIISIDKIVNQSDGVEGGRMDYPEHIINNIQESIDDKLNELKRNQPNDPDIVGHIEKEVNQLMLKAMSPIGDIWGRRFEQDKYYNLNSSVSLLFPSTAFQANPDISHVGTEECMFGELWRTYSHLFVSSFYQESIQPNYTIDSGLLFNALDKLNVNESYYAFAFGIYLDYYIDRAEGLVREEDRIYSYKGMKLLLLDSPTQVFAKRIYIMYKKERPYVEFSEPNDNQKKSMELKKYNEYGLWMSVQKVEGHEDTISEKNIEELGDEKYNYSVFHAIWLPRLYFKKQSKMICIKLNYKMTDEGTTDALETIKPFGDGEPT